MKKQYLLPKINLLVFVEEDIITDSATATGKTAVDVAKDDLNSKNTTSISMKSIVVLE